MCINSNIVHIKNKSSAKNCHCAYFKIFQCNSYQYSFAAFSLAAYCVYNNETIVYMF